MLTHGGSVRVEEAAAWTHYEMVPVEMGTRLKTGKLPEGLIFGLPFSSSHF